MEQSDIYKIYNNFLNKLINNNSSISNLDENVDNDSIESDISSNSSISSLYENKIKIKDDESDLNDDDIEYGGVPKLTKCVKSVMDIIFKNNFYRDFTKGELEEIYPQSQPVILGNIFDLNYILLSENLSDLNTILKNNNWIPLFYNVSNFKYISRKNKFFKDNAKLVIITFKVKDKLNYYKEINYEKDNKPKNMDNKSIVNIKIKGNDIFMVKTDYLTIHKIYKFNEKLKPVEIKKYSDIKPISVVNYQEIVEMFKGLFSLCTTF